jgi:xylan 1,4-beta-xylosidase
MRILSFLLCAFFIQNTTDAQLKTYCNPINIDYGYCPIPNFVEQGKHRATADPVITVFKGNYYMFSTNQWGYWWSPDMVKWNFVPRKFLKPWNKVYDELCAPATLVLGDTLLVIGSTYEKNFPLWMSTNPQKDEWKEAVDSFQVGAWDPGLFLDDDNRLYIYFGSSNFYPTYGQELDRKTFQPIGVRKELLKLNDKIHGWERFGEYHDNTFLNPFIEGSWMNKHNGKYYLQYGAPGTEFSGYGDGVYTADHPLGPFTYQSHNPFSYKPGGFANGAGHGATYQDLFKQWWHVSTIVVSTKNNFERRIGIWPAQIDKDGVLATNTAYGDYPHYIPNPKANHSESQFTGWMLLNYNKPIRVSSTLGGFYANLANDENIKTYWSASSGNKGEWIESDLGAISTVHAIQINYADQDAETMGKVEGLFHQYKLYGSIDGKIWNIIMDKSNNKTDLPHEYISFDKPIETRFIKLENIHMPSGKFAISGLRAFGTTKGSVPDTVQHFVVLRGDTERRNSWLKWQVNEKATGYMIYTGIAPDKLYTSMMVLGANEYYFSAMEKDLPYYFQIEAFNESGIGKRTVVTKVE